MDDRETDNPSQLLETPEVAPSGDVPCGSQGQSPATIDKERCIGSALSLGMRVAATKLERFRFWHFDANSGCGWNTEVDVPGSPLVFWRLAEQRMPNMRVSAFFSEIDVDRMHQLQRRLASNERSSANSYLLPGDNAEGIEVFAQMIRDHDTPRYAVGSVIVDPNGYFYRSQEGIGAPVEQALAFAAEFPRIDFILNLNTRQYRLQASHGYPQLALPEVFQALRKKHWIVRLTHHGRNEFVLAVGRNMPTGEHKGLGMHALLSEEGQHIIRRVEGMRQGALL
jgi:hypothetical protein